MTDNASALASLEEVLTALLDSETGCPWDREQTARSLCDYLIEETHELVEAIRHGSPAEACEELGDVAFLLVFVGRLFARQGSFSLDDALKVCAAKMVRRHPHVFAQQTFDSREEQLRDWERIKREEKTEAHAPQGTFSSLPRGLPPLVKAYRIHSKAARAGFTWETDADVEQQVEAEWLELLDACAGSDQEAIARELGDVLFTLVELGRRKGVKASAALDGTAHRFLARFASMEDAARARGAEFGALSMEEKNSLWDAAKAAEKAAGTPESAAPLEAE